MATQKPGEWANSLLARFEDQVIGVFVWKFSYIEFDGSSQKSKWHTHKHTHTSTESAKVKNAKRSSSRGTKNFRQILMVIEEKNHLVCVRAIAQKMCERDAQSNVYCFGIFFVYVLLSLMWEIHEWNHGMNENARVFWDISRFDSLFLSQWGGGILICLFVNKTTLYRLQRCRLNFLFASNFFSKKCPKRKDMPKIKKRLGKFS